VKQFVGENLTGRASKLDFMVTLSYDFRPAEIDAVRQVVSGNESTPYLELRRERNVDGEAPAVTRERIWQAHLIGLMTTQQSSGPESAVAKFLSEQSRDLSLDACREADDVESYVVGVLQESPYSVGFHTRIGKSCAVNLERLERDGGAGWERLEAELNRLVECRNQHPDPTHADVEREVARFLHAELAGEGLRWIGQKQSRNMLLMLGLSRYEIPLDSRLDSWTSSNFDQPSILADQSIDEYYAIAVDLLQEACIEADVLPCLFDAAAFADGDEWDRETLEEVLP
jgi:hypothetical protein